MATIVTDSTQIMTLLQEMEQYNLKNASPLPQEQELRAQWSGVGFRIGEYYFVVNLEHVREIMRYQRLSHVPGSKNWVRGIANVRGNLLPIFDLGSFLNVRRTSVRRETRILSISRGKLSAGLLVDEVFGMKHFDQERFVSSLGYDVDWQYYFDGGFLQENVKWVIFNLKLLIENAEFLHVAA